MPLTLYLLRHAKTQPAASGEADFDRLLYKEGIAQSKKLGQQLTALQIKPELIMSSPATRAQDTILNVSEQARFKADSILFEEIIYAGDTDDLISLVQSCDDQYRSLLITGHNPPITSLASFLVRSYTESMDPCDFLQIEFEVNQWSRVIKHSGKLKLKINGTSL